jgi:hypothetical protein
LSDEKVRNAEADFDCIAIDEHNMVRCLISHLDIGLIHAGAIDPAQLNDQPPQRFHYTDKIL